MDASFSTNAELEIHELNLAERDGSGITKIGSISSSSRFNRLAWSSHNSTSTEGVIIGGMEDGSVGFWDASKIISGASESECLIDQKIAHQGGVKGLQVNPFQPYLVASGAINSDILLWDLNSLQSYPPAQNKSPRMEDVTDLAWNCQVPHILASASNNGYTIIWDLKNRKEAIQLCLPGGRKSVSSISWNPENPTHILTATDDDSSPVIHSWDLRNAHAPTMTLTGHTKGVLSMSWCPKDSELLLSSGKDNRILCWNPKSGTLVNEVSHSSNWIFDTQWCPRNPDIFSSASFDGKVSINSFQALSSGQATKPAATVGSDPFASNVAQPMDQKVSAVRQIPKWLRRPIGASFGFGGRLVSFSENSGNKLSISSIPSQDREASRLLDEALRMNSLGQFCQSKLSHQVSSLHEKDPEAVFWNVVKVLVEQDPQKNLMNLLGFDKEKFDRQVKALKLQDVSESFGDLSLAAEEANEQDGSKSPIHFEGSEDNIFDQIASTPQTPRTPRHSVSATFSLFGPESSDTDRVITQAIIMGDFNTAVDVCIRSNRLSDALLVSICGGPELVAKTQEIYLQRVKYPYLRVVSAIIKNDLTDVVGSADVSNWEELLGLVCSFAPVDQFGQLCATLASRLEGHENMLLPTIICHMAAGNVKDAARAVLKLELPKAPSTKNGAFSYPQYATWLEGLVEKIRGVESASAVFTPNAQVNLQAELPEVASKYLEYAVLMANEGHLEIAARYFGLPSTMAESELVTLFGERLFNAVQSMNVGMAKVEAPFAPISVQPENAPVQPSAASPQQSFAQQSYGQPQQQAFNQQSFSQQSQFQQQPSGGFNAPPAPSAFPPQQQQQPQQQPGFGGSFAPSPFAQTSQPMGGFQPTPAAPAPFPPAPTQFSGPFAPMASHQPSVPPFPPAPQSTGAPAFPGAPTQQPAPFPPAPSAASFPPAPSAPSFPPQQAAPPAFPPMPSQQMASSPTGYGQPSMPQASPTDMTGFPGQFNPMQQQPGQFNPMQQQQYNGMPASRSGSGSAGNMAFPQQPQQPMAPSFPSVPAPPTIMSPSGIPAPSLESIRKPVGGFNDAPMVSPKQPLAPSFAHAVPQQQQQQLPSLPSQPHMPIGQPMSPTTTISPKVGTQMGPVDPGKIPPNSQQIYQTIQSLIQFCQQRALPVQRRVVEDSVKRLQFLFHQLANAELSPHVHGELLRVCPLIQQRQYETAIEWHVPLMTAHFAEVGQWILAIKRLLDVAKACPQ